MTARWSSVVGRGARSSSASWCAPRPAPPAAATPSRPAEQRRHSAAASARRCAMISGQPLELLAADRRLDVGHAVVEAEHRVLLEDHLRAAVPHRVGHAHPVLAQQAELARPIPGSRVVSMPPSPVVITLRGWNEKQATSPCGRPILSHSPFQTDLAADRAGRVLDHRQAVRARDRQDRARDRTACRSGARTRIARVRGVIAASISGGIDVVGRRARCRRRPASRRSSGWRWRWR